jgi:hypothetical protein
MGCWANCPGTGLFGKGNDCRDCKDRCNSWFPGDSEIQCGCKERCASSDTGFTRDEYLNSIGHGPIQQAAIEEYNAEVLAMAEKDAAELRETMITMVSVGAGLLLTIALIFAVIKISKG